MECRILAPTGPACAYIYFLRTGHAPRAANLENRILRSMRSTTRQQAIFRSVNKHTSISIYANPNQRDSAPGTDRSERLLARQRLEF